MEKIIIVDAISSGVNYIQDVIDNGYEPIVLFSCISDAAYDVIKKEQQDVEQQNKDNATFYYATSNYEDTYKLVKDINPKLILPGCEDGVELAYRLCQHLNLPSNSYSKIKNFTDKYHMHKVLENAGIRSIPSTPVRTYDDLSAFIEKYDITSFILKPARGAGGVGFFSCDDISLAKEVYEKASNEDDFYGLENNCLIAQEKINGKEYVVNTLSQNGKTILTSFWRYEITIEDASLKLYSKNGITDDYSNYEELINYAFKVVEAIGVEYGPVHGEYMIDEKGPVLIEVNCRPMGCSYPVQYSDMVFGHHETDVSLKSYLEGETPKISFENMKYGGVIMVVASPVEKTFYSIPGTIIINKLPGKWQAHWISKDNKVLKTTNLEKAAGVIMGCTAKDNIDWCFEYVKDLQNNYFDLMFDINDAQGQDSLEYLVSEFYDAYENNNKDKQEIIEDLIKMRFYNKGEAVINKLLDVYTFQNHFM